MQLCLGRLQLSCGDVELRLRVLLAEWCSRSAFRKLRDIGQPLLMKFDLLLQPDDIRARLVDVGLKHPGLLLRGDQRHFELANLVSE